MSKREDAVAHLQIIWAWAAVRDIRERECAKMTGWLSDAIELLRQGPVSCGSCRHYDHCLIAGGHEGSPDWFCADGEAEVQTRIETEEDDGTGDEKGAQPH